MATYNNKFLMTIKIVIDSTCDLPPALIKKYDITVVPVYINIGDKSYREGIDLSRQEFYKNLYEYSDYPTTAAPPVGIFTEVYERVTAAGATEILSLHIAASLSNTFNAARLGADEADCVPVTLFDTKQITLGSGLLALTAAQAIAAGHNMDEVMVMLEARVSRTYVFGMINTLESLRRSGRVSWAEFGLGTLLQIKPVMMIHASEVSIIAKVRTRKRAQKHVLSLVEEMRPFEQLAVLHVQAPEAALELKDMAAHLFPSDEEPIIMEVTPAVGTHLGLGAVGFTCITINDN